MTHHTLNRRQLFRSSTLGLAAVTGWQANIIAQASTLRSNAPACILLWMGGGPSQLDTWDPKPNSGNAGDAGTGIQTTIPGVQISDRLPKTPRP